MPTIDSHMPKKLRERKIDSHRSSHIIFSEKLPEICPFLTIMEKKVKITQNSKNIELISLPLFFKNGSKSLYTQYANLEIHFSPCPKNSDHIDAKSLFFSQISTSKSLNSTFKCLKSTFRSLITTHRAPNSPPRHIKSTPNIRLPEPKVACNRPNINFQRREIDSQWLKIDS